MLRVFSAAQDHGEKNSLVVDPSFNSRLFAAAGFGVAFGREPKAKGCVLLITNY